MYTKRLLIALILIMSLIFANTVSFAEIEPVTNRITIIPHQAYNVITGEMFKLTDLTDNKYNFFVYGGADCFNTNATLMALDKFISITKPGTIQAFYFDINEKSNQEVIDLGIKGNLKNIILCSDENKTNKYNLAAWEYFRKFNKTSESSFIMPLVVLTDKNGEIKYFQTEAQGEGALYEALAFVAKNDDIFVSEYVNYGLGIAASNVKLFEEQKTSIEIANAYLKPTYKVNPEAESIKTLAEEITGNIRGNDEHSEDYLKLKAIYTWVAKNIFYDEYYYKGFINSTALAAEDVLNSRYSVCEGYANLLSALCRASDIPIKAVYGYAIGSAYEGIWTEDLVTSSQTNHKWNEAFVDDRWIILDVTWDSHNKFLDKKRMYEEFYAGKYGEGVSEWNVEGEVTYTYFDCSVEKISEMHKIVHYEAVEAIISTPSIWAVKEIDLAKKERLVIREITDDYQKNISREEFCKLVVNLYQINGGVIPEVSVSKFKDTNTKEILIANTLGIVNGVSDDEFSPNTDITREGIATMMRRMIELNGTIKIENNLKKYADYQLISPWALDSLAYLNNINIINGISDNKIAPKQNATREQAVLIVYRLFEYLAR